MELKGYGQASCTPIYLFIYLFTQLHLCDKFCLKFLMELLKNPHVCTLFASTNQPTPDISGIDRSCFSDLGICHFETNLVHHFLASFQMIGMKLDMYLVCIQTTDASKYDWSWFGSNKCHFLTAICFCDFDELYLKKKIEKLKGMTIFYIQLINFLYSSLLAIFLLKGL